MQMARSAKKKKKLVVFSFPFLIIILLEMIVVGYPNVGKSTLINTLREAHGTGRKVARTGARPGVTRAVSSKHIKKKKLEK